MPVGLVSESFLKKKIPNIMGLFYVPVTPNIMGLFMYYPIMGPFYVHQIPNNIMGLFYVYYESFLYTMIKVLPNVSVLGYELYL